MNKMFILYLSLIWGCHTKSSNSIYEKHHFFQPSQEEMSFASKVFEKKNSTEKRFIYQKIPYYKYWQLDKETKYVFHPMDFGAYLIENSKQFQSIQEVLELVQKVSVKLPNNGIGFYYPNHYPLARMNGEEIMMSGISQSTILTGAIKIHQRFPGKESGELLEKVLNGVFFPWSEGGVDLNGIVQLEMPLFSSNPEIILNGWLHALLSLNDYALTFKDNKIQDYVEKNLSFFLRNNTVWYDSERKISRYSDTSPLRVKIEFPEVGIDENISVHYLPLLNELPRINVSSDVIFRKNKISSYGTGVRKKRKKSLELSLNCSQLYKTEIKSKRKFIITYRKASYDPMASAPKSNESISVPAQEIKNQFIFVFDPSNKDLICGYPTNFSKGKTKSDARKINFYHMHHIMALLYLAHQIEYRNPDLKPGLIAVAKKWYEEIADFKYKKVSDFEKPQKVLDNINKLKLLMQETDANITFKKSGIKIFNEHRL